MSEKSDRVQISAEVSRATKRNLDAFARATGLKKSRIIEDAVNHHLQVLQEIPTEYIVPTRVVVTRESGRRILDALHDDSEPTDALRELMALDPDSIDDAD